MVDHLAQNNPAHVRRIVADLTSRQAKAPAADALSLSVELLSVSVDLRFPQPDPRRRGALQNALSPEREERGDCRRRQAANVASTRLTAYDCNHDCWRHDDIP
jgi:hypothetical protein